jgi:hypothetical protein
MAISNAHSQVNGSMRNDVSNLNSLRIPTPETPREADVSKINAIASAPFGGVTTDAIARMLPLDLSEHY